ncbi:MAG TPA: hypothetical protein VJK52_02490 [Candidatus Nanoarchaeia archaeon]|nr:hypothetical protein [Candidatus Nanoarchaeia archaeon]
MELKILKEKQSPLLARKRITLSGTFSGATPSRLELTQAVARVANAKPEHTIVRHVYTKFGRGEAKVICHVYEKAEDLERLEEGYLKIKHKSKEEQEAYKKAKQAAAAAAAPAKG